MKSKTALALIVLSLSGGLSFSQGTEKNFPAQLSFVYPVGTSGLRSGEICYNFSLNALMGVTGGINGCEIGGLVNINKSDMRGLQVGGIANITKGYAAGVQIGGLLSTAYNFYGLQTNGLAGIANDVKGLQINGLVGKANDVKGVQVSGIINLSKSANVSIGGIANINSEKVNGIQIGGILNQTKELNGIQIGLINVVDTVVKGGSLGLINIIKKGYYDEFTVSVSDYANVAISYKSGMKSFYNIYSVGMNVFKEHLWITGFGFGHLTEVSSNFAFQPELMYYNYFPADFRHIRETHFLHLKLGLVRNINETLAISFAPSVYAGLKSDRGIYSDYGYEQSIINPVIQIYPASGNSLLEMGFGFSLGLNIR